MNKHRFTLTELLVVIAIIGILAGMVFPATNLVRNKARRTQAKSDMSSIVMAVGQFKADYQCMPVSNVPVLGSNSKKFYACGATPEDNYLEFFDVLTYTNHTGSSTAVSNSVKASNPKKRKYLEPGKDYFSSDTKLNSFRDPWNRPYMIFLDVNYDNKISVAGDDSSAKTLSTLKFALEADVIHKDVLVVSRGKEDNKKNDVSGFPASDTDLIFSWK